MVTNDTNPYPAQVDEYPIGTTITWEPFTLTRAVHGLDFVGWAEVVRVRWPYGGMTFTRSVKRSEDYLAQKSKTEA